MSKKLSATNPYLRDPVQRERAVLQSVASSSAIEGIHAPFRQRSSRGGKFAATTKPASVRKSGITR
jgi:Fic family protein